MASAQNRLLFTALFVLFSHTLLASGTISQELAAKVSEIFPPGTSQGQILALFGDPELANNVKGIVVWRYVSGDKYVLFGFVDGKLDTAVVVPRVAARAPLPAPALVPAPVPVTASVPVALNTWRPFYETTGSVLLENIGHSEEEVFDAWAKVGLPAEQIKCETDTAQPTIRLCTIDTTSLDWKTVAPPESSASLFILAFEDGRFRSSFHAIRFPDDGICKKVHADIRAVFAKSFDKPAERLGWWKRKTSSLLLPMASIAEGATWEDGERMASVTRGTVGTSSSQSPAILVVIGEKDSE